MTICFCQYNYGLEVEKFDAKIEGRLNLNYGFSSVYIGEDAGIAARLSASANTIIGHNSGNSITTSRDNTILGSDSG